MKHIASPIIILVLSIFFVGFSSQSASALTATQYCNGKYKGTTKKADQLRAACVKGYGLKTKCADLPKGANTTKAEIKTACDDGFASGSIALGGSLGGGATSDAGASLKNCGDIQTSIIKCDKTGGNPVISVLLQVINFLAVGVGIAVVGGITWGGILYASSNGDSAKINQGKMAIVNSIIGLFLFIFMYALINFIVPGGLFN